MGVGHRRWILGVFGGFALSLLVVVVVVGLGELTYLFVVCLGNEKRVVV